MNRSYYIHTTEAQSKFNITIYIKHHNNTMHNSTDLTSALFSSATFHRRAMSFPIEALHISKNITWLNGGNASSIHHHGSAECRRFSDFLCNPATVSTLLNPTPLPPHPQFLFYGLPANHSIIIWQPHISQFKSEGRGMGKAIIFYLKEQSGAGWPPCLDAPPLVKRSRYSVWDDH